VRAGQKIMTLSINPDKFKLAKESLISAGHKLPTAIRLVVEKGQELISS
jgi:large subunit ribosomal protein L10e